MSEIPPYDDEIDLFELIETLWANKLAIIAATMLSMMGAGSFWCFKPRIMNHGWQFLFI